MMQINYKRLFKLSIFLPLIFYFGKRSYLAYDEGFYALQARWILEKGNWTIPLWWDSYILDRTIGIQVLIAKSQEIFGKNIFAAYLPTTIAAIIMLVITYKLHEELIGKKFALTSPLILATTYLWFDYSHLATQDLVYSSLVTIGIFALVKIKSDKDLFFILLFGIWIGLAFMMKTFLVAIPLVSLFPYLIKKKYILSTKFFWLGLLIGFIPFIWWTLSINTYLDRNIIFYLFDKFNILSKQNDSSNPFYYYLWNIPVTFLPWSIFSFVGLTTLIINKQKESFILLYFPVILILLISMFSTKTPYYPLQISSILSINAYIGIEYLINSKKFKFIIFFITSRLIPLLIFLTICLYYFIFKNSINFTIKENIFTILGLIFLSICWASLKQTDNKYRLLIKIIIGPYLMTSMFLQSGLFTDRSRELREAMNYLTSLNIIKDQTIKVETSSINNEESHSKIIRIALLTPNLGEGIKSIKNIDAYDLAWTTAAKYQQNQADNYEIIYDNKILSPWILVRKNQ